MTADFCGETWVLCEEGPSPHRCDHIASTSHFVAQSATVSALMGYVEGGSAQSSCHITSAFVLSKTSMAPSNEKLTVYIKQF